MARAIVLDNSVNKFRRLVYFILGALVLAATALRTPGIFWLDGIGEHPEYSFHGDDQRFITLARDFQTGLPDGYVHGMTTHLLGLEALAKFFTPDPNLLHLLHTVTLIYAGLTFLLIFFMAKFWSMNNHVALLGTFFLATSPIHVANSNLATADVTAVFYFYLTLLVTAKYLRTKEQLWFVLSAALTGAAIAIKFFIPLLLPLGLLVIIHRGRQLLSQAIIAAFVAIGVFQTVLLFNYTQWDFANFFGMLRYDNVTITAGNSPLRQFVLYIWDSIGALSIPVWILLTLGIGILMINAARKIVGSPKSLQFSWKIIGNWREIITPNFLLFSALSAHAVLIIFSGIHAVRHLLVFVPAACIGAAYTLVLIWDHFRSVKFLPAASLLTLGIYGTANAIAVERLYIDDVRADLEKTTNELATQGKIVNTFHRWTIFKSTKFTSETVLNPNHYLVTCDLEYTRYLRRDNADQIYAAFGGQARLNFYRDIFENRSKFKILKMYKQLPLSIEQKLIDIEVLRPIGTYLPKKCFLIGVHGTPAEIQRSDIFPRFYYVPGW